MDESPRLIDIPDDEKAARMAAKKNARRAARWPLLAWAGLLAAEQVTAADIQAGFQRMNEREIEFFHRMLARAAFYRAQVARWHTTEELAALDEHRQIYPWDAARDADFWWQQWCAAVKARIERSPILSEDLIEPYRRQVEQAALYRAQVARWRTAEEMATLDEWRKDFTNQRLIAAAIKMDRDRTHRYVLTDATRDIEFWLAQWRLAVRQRIEQSPLYP